MAYRYTVTSPPEIMVVIIASHLRRSKMIPVTPNINETGNENMANNPTRIVRGLPHPK